MAVIIFVHNLLYPFVESWHTYPNALWGRAVRAALRKNGCRSVSVAACLWGFPALVRFFSPPPSQVVTGRAGYESVYEES